MMIILFILQQSRKEQLRLQEDPGPGQSIPERQHGHQHGGRVHNSGGHYNTVHRPQLCSTTQPGIVQCQLMPPWSHYTLAYYIAALSCKTETT